MTDIYESMLDYLEARHEAYLNRLAGDPVGDSLIRNRRFSNVFQACNREDQHLIRVLYPPINPFHTTDKVVQIALHTLLGGEVYQLLSDEVLIISSASLKAGNIARYVPDDAPRTRRIIDAVSDHLDGLYLVETQRRVPAQTFHDLIAQARPYLTYDQQGIAFNQMTHRLTYLVDDKGTPLVNLHDADLGTHWYRTEEVYYSGLGTMNAYLKVTSSDRCPRLFGRKMGYGDYLVNVANFEAYRNATAPEHVSKGDMPLPFFPPQYVNEGELQQFLESIPEIINPEEVEVNNDES